MELFMRYSTNSSYQSLFGNRSDMENLDFRILRQTIFLIWAEGSFSNSSGSELVNVVIIRLFHIYKI